VDFPYSLLPCWLLWVIYIFSVPQPLPLTAIQRRISYFELLRSTNDFHESNLLGVGSYGSVYQCVTRWGHGCARMWFRIAKLLGESESIAQTKTLATIGYMAPGDACSSKYLIKHILWHTKYLVQNMDWMVLCPPRLMSTALGSCWWKCSSEKSLLMKCLREKWA